MPELVAAFAPWVLASSGGGLTKVWVIAAVIVVGVVGWVGLRRNRNK